MIRGYRILNFRNYASMPYRRVVESVGNTGAWALFLVEIPISEQNFTPKRLTARHDRTGDDHGFRLADPLGFGVTDQVRRLRHLPAVNHFLIFVGSQTLSFFFATAPQSLQL